MEYKNLHKPGVLSSSKDSTGTSRGIINLKKKHYKQIICTLTLSPENLPDEIKED